MAGYDILNGNYYLFFSSSVFITTKLYFIVTLKKTFNTDNRIGQPTFDMEDLTVGLAWKYYTGYLRPVLRGDLTFFMVDNNIVK